MPNKFIKFFNELEIKDVPEVGGKNASLGEMYQKLASQGVRVPNGFATTAYAYNYFLDKADLRTKIAKILKGLNTHNVNDLIKRGALVRKAILAAKIPADLEDAIATAYNELAE